MTRIKEYLRVRSVPGGNQVQSSWTESDPTSPAYIINKPELSEYGDIHFTYTITHKLTETINHSLGKIPAITVLDTTGNTCITEVLHIDENTVTISFSDYFTGKVIMN